MNPILFRSFLASAFLASLFVSPAWAAYVTCDPKTFSGDKTATARFDPGQNYPDLCLLMFTFSQLLWAVFALVGLGSFLYLLVGGFKYLNASGDAKALDGAKNSITYALLGLFGSVVAFLLIDTINGLLGLQTTGLGLPAGFSLRGFFLPSP